MNLSKKVAFFLFISVMLTIAACGNNEEDANNANANDVDENWPEDDITINIHADSGNLDTAVRQIRPMLEEEVDQDIIVENRPGGGQAVSQTETQSEPADGYTFQTITSSTSFGMATDQIPFEPEDWSVVGSMQQEPASIAVPSDSPLEDIDDFVEEMKDDPENLVVGGYQSDGYMRYVYYKLQQMGDFEGKWIPVDTTDEVATDLLGGHIDVAIMTPSTALSALEDDDIKLLGVASEEELDTYPDVDTFKDQGYDMVEELYRGIMAKEGTPQNVIDQMHDAMQEAAEDSEWKEFQENQNQEMDDRTPKELD